MRFPCAVMSNFTELCSTLRKAYFGKDALVSDYKDSYVINQAIESFADSPNALISEYLTALDKKDTKVTKTLTLRQGCVDKLKACSEVLGISEAEVLRRLIYYTLQNEIDTETDATVLNLAELKAELAVLEKQFSAVMATLDVINRKIEKLENKKSKRA